MSIHTGHRERLKERFRKEGLKNFDQLYVLEMLLFYCVPRQDTNILAHRLLDRFGSVSKAIAAPVEELEKVEGIGQGVSTFFSLLRQLRIYCDMEREDENLPLASINACADFLIPYFMDKRNETVMLLMLDAKCMLLDCKQVSEGSINSVGFSVRRVVEMALAANATTVILAHNHPGGVALPSEEDIQTTQRVANALRSVDVILADHLVFSGKEWVSMAKSKYYSSSFNET